ncbi:MAG TPA: hypothetical protein DCQ14_01865 [Firmicutes bacterium]|nr:hypothetical protein [Bacillota bacterium]
MRPARKRLRVIKGGMGAPREKGKGAGQDRAAVFLLLLLGLFLMAQMLLGWVWSSFNRNAGGVITVVEGSVDLALTTGGILTFAEELLFAPQSGFIHYRIIEGERVPVGREMAVITAYLQENTDTESEQAQGNGDYLERFRRWLSDDRDETDSLSSEFFPVHDREHVITANRAGLVSLRVDGWEMFGPDTAFIYLNAEEFQQKTPGVQLLGSGEKVSRFMPIMRIMDNYRWYYSTILPPEPGKMIAEEAYAKLRFSFAPDQPIYAEKVEARKREEGDLEITWQMNQAVGDFYNHRWSTAEIIYDHLEGILIPKDTMLEVDGKKGVFVVVEGTVVFQEVNLLAEKDDYFLVEDLTPDARVIARPGRVKEGQRLLW